MQDLIGLDLAVIANTADDTRIHGLHVSPDPDLVTYWLAGEIDEERGWGIRDDTFVVHERLERLGAPGLVPALGPRSGDLPLPDPLHGRGRNADGGAGPDRASARRERQRPSHGEEPVATRVLTPIGSRGLQEFLIVDALRAAIEGVEVQGIGDASPRRRSWTRSRPPTRRHRPLQPGDLDRADPRRAGDARGDRRIGRAGRRGEPIRRRPGGQGADGAVHGGGRAGPPPPPAWRLSTRG